MERMNKEELEKLKDFKVYVFEGEVYVKAEDYKEKAIENKNLRKEKGNIRQRLVALEKKLETLSRVKENKELIKENKNLNIKVASLEGEIKGLNSVIEKLKEENQTLELWLDNKEKVNKSLREDVDYFRQCYLDLKKLCEKEGFMLSDEEVTKMFNLDKKE